MTTTTALHAYRHLLRATKLAFANDTALLHASRDQARATFLKNKVLAAQSAEAEAQIRHAEEVARVLRRNVVQGRKVDDQRWRLDLRGEIERGDNSSVKQGRGKQAA